MLEDHIHILEEKLVQIAAQINVEVLRHEKSEYRFALDDYLVGAREKRKNFLEAIVVADHKITKLREEIRDEFSEMKKFEIIMQKRIEEEKAALDAEETRMLDEISIMRAKNQEKL
jgi:hypothetical protein